MSCQVQNAQVSHLQSDSNNGSSSAAKKKNASLLFQLPSRGAAAKVISVREEGDTLLAKMAHTWLMHYYT